MVRVLIEVRSGATRFDVVWAESVERAVNLVRVSYPAYDARGNFPIDPEGFFAEDPATWAGVSGFDRSGGMAA